MMVSGGRQAMHDMVASCRVPGRLQPWVSVCGSFPVRGPFLPLAQALQEVIAFPCCFAPPPHHTPFLLCGHLLLGDRFSLCSQPCLGCHRLMNAGIVGAPFFWPNMGDHRPQDPSRDMGDPGKGIEMEFGSPSAAARG